jgi:hypothetical protein
MRRCVLVNNASLGSGCLVRSSKARRVSLSTIEMEVGLEQGASGPAARGARRQGLARRPGAACATKARRRASRRWTRPSPVKPGGGASDRHRHPRTVCGFSWVTTRGRRGARESSSRATMSSWRPRCCWKRNGCSDPLTDSIAPRSPALRAVSRAAAGRARLPRGRRAGPRRVRCRPRFRGRASPGWNAAGRCLLHLRQAACPGRQGVGVDGSRLGLRRQLEAAPPVTPSRGPARRAAYSSIRSAWIAARMGGDP